MNYFTKRRLQFHLPKLQNETQILHVFESFVILLNLLGIEPILKIFIHKNSMHQKIMYIFDFLENSN